MARRGEARRGQPEDIRSDKGTNFVGANHKLRKTIKTWNQDKINGFLVQRNVRWTFNPPKASHHGGVWERCIRTVRKVLNALTKDQELDDERLTTLMCEVEANVNNRPITKVSDDPKDLQAFTSSTISRRPLLEAMDERISSVFAATAKMVQGPKKLLCRGYCARD